jgi:uncharacterized membrane protein
MTLSDIVTLVGLAIGTVGAIFLAYDVVYGPGKAFQANVINTKLQNMREFRALNQRGIRNYPQPPYTPQEIQEFLEKEEQDWGPQERDLVKQDSEFMDRYENRVVTLGAFGVLLIVAGFLLQIAGLVIHACRKKNQPNTNKLELKSLFTGRIYNRLHWTFLNLDVFGPSIQVTIAEQVPKMQSNF